MPQLVTKPLSFFKLDPAQPRQEFDEGELRLLGESMQSIGQIQPTLARPDGRLLAGARRYRAACLVGMDSLLTILTERMLSDTEIRVIQLTENLHRADLSGFEKWRACVELLDMNAGWTQRDVSKAIKVSEAQVTKYLSPSRCIAPFQQALKDGKVTLSHCYTASRLSEPEQQGLLNLILAGATSEQVARAGRKSRVRTDTAATVKRARVRCPLPTGATVVVSGAPLDLSGFIDTLSVALELARRAHKEALDVKTAEQVWRDKARSG